MHHFEFTLSIPAKDVQLYYRGSVNKVIARCKDGRTVQFPARLLTPFVTSAGVCGVFEMTCDDDTQNAVLRRKTSSTK